METLLALIAALALASIPITIGWRRTMDEASMARAMGIAQQKKGFDPDKLARQTGTGLAFNQIAFGFLTWAGGGFAGGIFLGFFAAILFAIAGGLLYAGTLSDKRQEFRLRQAKDILRGLGVVETLLTQGKPLNDALDEAAQAVGPDGKLVLSDLVVRLRTAPADEAALAVREWTTAWDNPAVDIVATSLLASLEGRIEISPLVAALRRTLGAVVEVLSRARAAAKGVEWQARFLALFPPSVLVIIAVTTPDTGRLYSANPLLLTPVIFGSGISYWLSTRMIRNGLSIEASMGLQAGQQGEIRLDRLGRVL
jgi:Flp pilus assembly protein TadB